MGIMRQEKGITLGIPLAFSGACQGTLSGFRSCSLHFGGRSFAFHRGGRRLLPSKSPFSYKFQKRHACRLSHMFVLNGCFN